MNEKEKIKLDIAYSMGCAVLSLEKTALDIAYTLNIKTLGNISSNEVPKDKIFWNWENFWEIKNITKVACCMNLLCMIFFTEDNKCYAIRNSSIRKTSGQEAFMKIFSKRDYEHN